MDVLNWLELKKKQLHKKAQAEAHDKHKLWTITHTLMIHIHIEMYSVGNCWFVAAASTLATKPDLLHQVVPQDQGFDRGTYAGK